MGIKNIKIRLPWPKIPMPMFARAGDDLYNETRRFTVGCFYQSKRAGEMALIDIDSNSPNLQVTVRTLTVGGFILEKASRFPGYALIYMYRYDEFGVRQQYCFALFERKPASGQIQAAETAANHHKAELVVISPTIGS